MTPEEKPTRVQIVADFYAAPENALFDQKVIAAVRDCSTYTLERDRWAGGRIPFIKIKRAVRYRKADVLTWLENTNHSNQHLMWWWRK